MNSAGKNYPIIIAQIIAWVIMFITPVITSMTVSGEYIKLSFALGVSARTVGPMFLLYSVNYFLLAPLFLFSAKYNKSWFYILNAIIIIAWNAYNFFSYGQMINEYSVPMLGRGPVLTLRIVGALSRICTDCLVVAIAAGILKIVNANKLLVKYEQERRNAVEAEISWLKNQINPHFLFNTLNNISSLTQIDPEKAQDSICQLSGLLRYALYDSEKEMVPLDGEIEFMENYIQLMQLRCNEKAQIECNFEKPEGQVQIAPLLFISLIENAFKHGVNARKDSFVRIDMHPEGKDLVFSSKNTMFEKQASDHIGSGIGLDNMKKRLALLYPESYEYYTESTDEYYYAVVRLKKVLK